MAKVKSINRKSGEFTVTFGDVPDQIGYVFNAANNYQVDVTDEDHLKAFVQVDAYKVSLQEALEEAKVKK